MPRQSKSIDAGTRASMGRVDTQPTNLIAIAAMILSTLAYLLGDTVVKLASEILPVTQIIVVRGLMTTALVASVAAATGALAAWRRMFDGPILLRGIFDAATTLMLVHAIAKIPIADVTVLVNSAPVVATVLAILILGEKVGIRRWSAVLLGFAGVVLVVRPSGEGFDAFGLLACGAAVTVALRELVTRKVAAEVPSLVVTLCSAASVSVAGSAASAITGSWTPMGWSEIGMLAGAAVLLFAAYHLSVISLRLGEVSLVGPFRYTVILWGLLIGYLIWGDVPEPAAVLGMLLITASGLYVLRREYQMHRRRS